MMARAPHSASSGNPPPKQAKIIFCRSEAAQPKTKNLQPEPERDTAMTVYDSAGRGGCSRGACV